MARKINIGEGESLRSGAEKINEAMEEVNSFQDQIDTIVVEGDSSVEAAQARIDAENNEYSTLKERLDTEHTEVTSQLEQINQKLIDEELTVNIPSDFPTLQEAIDELSNKFISQKVIINLNIESGHQPSSGIIILNRDCANFRITSHDEVVTVANDFAGDFIRGENSRLPILASLIDMNDLGENGYYAYKSCYGVIENGAGILRADRIGLYVNGASVVEADESIFKESGYRNVWVTRSSTLSAEYSDFSSCKGDISVYVSQGSVANLPYSNVSNSTGHGVVAVGSRLACREVDVSDSGNNGITGQKGSYVTAESADATNCTQGIVLEGNSNGFFYGADVSNSTEKGIWLRHGSSAECQNIVALNCGEHAVRADDGSHINLRNGNVENVGSAWSLLISRGSIINANGATTPNGPINEGDTPVSSFNTLDARGIIFA